MAITHVANGLASGGNNGPHTVTLSSLTGSNCLIVVCMSMRDIGSSPTYSATWNGVAMTLRRNEFVAMGGFGKGAAVVWTATVGNLSAVTANAVVTLSGADSSTQVFVTAVCLAGVDQTTPVWGNDGASLASSAATTSTTVPGSAEGVVDVLSEGSTSTITIGGSGHTQMQNQNNAGSGRDALAHASGRSFTSGGTISWTFSGSYAWAAAYLNESASSPPAITTVDSDDAFLITQTNMIVVGVNFAPGGTTELYYANGATWALATKVLQTISSVTGTSITWTSVTKGAVTGAGTRYVYVVTDAGGGGQQISAAKAVTVTAPPTPAITSITGGSSVDTTDTNKTVNGTGFVSIGTTVLYLADSTNFATAMKVLQTITSVTNTSVNWTAVTMGALSPGSLYLFMVADSGGAHQDNSAAFAVTITTPTTPTLTSVASGRTRFYPSEVNLAVVGTNLNPGGTTKLYWADSTNFATAVKQDQTITSITGTTLTWVAINLGSVGEGFFYIFAVTKFGGVQQRESLAFAIRVQSAVTPSISSVAGAAAIQDDAVNTTVYGIDFAQPGTTRVYYANGSTWLTATKVLQTIHSITDTTLVWDAVVQGAVGAGYNYLYVITDYGGANEQVSPAFLIEVLTDDDELEVRFLGDDEGGIFSPVLNPDVPEPASAVLLLRDHMCWTGIGTWYYARDFFKHPTATSDLTIEGQLTGPLSNSKAVRLVQIAMSGSWRLRNNEQINLFTEAARYKFVVGVWINIIDWSASLNELSVFKIFTSGLTAYVELSIRRVSGSLRIVGAYYTAGVRYEKVSTAIISETPINDYYFVVLKVAYDADPRITINLHGNVQTQNVAVAPPATLYDVSHLGDSYSASGGSNLIGLKFFGLFYGMADVSTADVTTLRTSANLAAYETGLRTVFGSQGPVHYYRTDDKVIDRYVHNHEGSFLPATAIGGTFTRGILIGTYGGIAMYCMRFQGGCRGEATVTSSFSTWGCTLLAHIRFVGASGNTGILLKIAAANGACIELSKTSAGFGPNEGNGRLRIVIKSSSGVTILDDTVSTPAMDPFNGLVHTYVLSTGSSLSNWKLTVDGVATWATALGSVPSWHGNTYTVFTMAGADVDCHSVGYKNAYDSAAHSSWHIWSTVYDLLNYMQTNSYNAAYWNQNTRAND